MPWPARMLVNTNGRSPRNAPRVALHHGEIGADQRREVDFVDHQEVGAGDPGSALARDLVAGGDVDDVDREVGELRAEGGGEVITTGLDEDEVERRERLDHLIDGGEIDRGP